MTHPRDDLHAEIAALRDRVEYLEAELALAHEQSAVPDAEFVAAIAMGLPRWAMPALHLFLSQRLVTNDRLTAMAEAMDGWELSAPQFSNVVAYRLRRALRPLGVDIETVWGVGYSISPENQARLQVLMHH